MLNSAKLLSRGYSPGLQDKFKLTLTMSDGIARSAIAPRCSRCSRLAGPHRSNGAVLRRGNSLAGPKRPLGIDSGWLDIMDGWLTSNHARID